MEYTKVRRELIYKDKTDLNDFGVKEEGNINNYFFMQMRKMTLLRCGDAKNIALKCLNNAYYICTLIELEDFPDICMDRFEAKLLEERISFPEDVYQASMALVCVLLAAYDDKYKKRDDPLIDSIHHWTSSNKWLGSSYHKSFEDIIGTCSSDGYTLPPDTFTPRDIIEVIESKDIYIGINDVEYICDRLNHLDDKQRGKHGADMAIARMERELLEFCDDTCYDLKRDKFFYDDNGIMDYNYEEEVREEVDKRRNAIKYIKAHYPKGKVTDNVVYTPKKVTLEQEAYNKLVSENTELKKQLSLYASKYTELEKQNAELMGDDNITDDTVMQKTSKEPEETQKLNNELKLENERLENEVYDLKSENEELRRESASDNKVKELEDKLMREENLHRDTLIALLKPTFKGSETDARDFLEKIEGHDDEYVADVMNQFAKQGKVNPKRKKRRTWEILKAAKLYDSTEQNWSNHMRKTD